MSDIVERSPPRPGGEMSDEPELTETGALRFEGGRLKDEIERLRAVLEEIIAALRQLVLVAGEDGMSDHRIIADGLFPGGMDPAKLTEIGRGEVRAAVDALLRIWDRDNARLALALKQLDKAAEEIERLRAALHAIGHGYEEVERVGTCAYARWALASKHQQTPTNIATTGKSR